MTHWKDSTRRWDPVVTDASSLLLRSALFVPPSDMPHRIWTIIELVDAIFHALDPPARITDFDYTTIQYYEPAHADMRATDASNRQALNVITLLNSALFKRGVRARWRCATVDDLQVLWRTLLELYQSAEQRALRLAMYKSCVRHVKVPIPIIRVGRGPLPGYIIPQDLRLPRLTSLHWEVGKRRLRWLIGDFEEMCRAEPAWESVTITCDTEDPALGRLFSSLARVSRLSTFRFRMYDPFCETVVACLPPLDEFLQHRPTLRKLELDARTLVDLLLYPSGCTTFSTLRLLHLSIFGESLWYASWALRLVDTDAFRMPTLLELQLHEFSELHPPSVLLPRGSEAAPMRFVWKELLRVLQLPVLKTAVFRVASPESYALLDHLRIHAPTLQDVVFVTTSGLPGPIDSRAHLASVLGCQNLRHVVLRIQAGREPPEEQWWKNRHVGQELSRWQDLLLLEVLELDWDPIHLFSDVFNWVQTTGRRADLRWLPGLDDLGWLETHQKIRRLVVRCLDPDPGRVPPSGDAPPVPTVAGRRTVRVHQRAPVQKLDDPVTLARAFIEHLPSVQLSFGTVPEHSSLRSAYPENGDDWHQDWRRVAALIEHAPRS